MLSNLHKSLSPLIRSISSRSTYFSTFDLERTQSKLSEPVLLKMVKSTGQSQPKKEFREGNRGRKTRDKASDKQGATSDKRLPTSNKLAKSTIDGQYCFKDLATLSIN